MVLGEWEISPESVRAVATDNANTMKAAISLSFHEARHFGCFAHTINLIVKAALNISDIDAIVSKVRCIILFVNNSVVQSDKLRKIQLETGEASEILEPILDVRTRWNLEWFIQMSRIFVELVMDNFSAPDLPNTQEVKIITEMASLLKSFEYVTKDASRQNVTISKVVPMINCIYSQLTSFYSDIQVINSFKSTLLSETKRRFSAVEFNEHTALSTILDPRFKNLHLRDPVSCARVIKKNTQCTNWTRSVIYGTTSESD